MTAVCDCLSAHPEVDIPVIDQETECAVVERFFIPEESLPLRPEVRCLQRWMDLNA